MPEENFTELQALLRLKRYETPPADYHEDFLVEFHHRQRIEMLHRPLWRIALDRLGNLVPTMPALPMPNLAYAGAGALALVAAAGLVSRQVNPNPVGATLASAPVSADRLQTIDAPAAVAPATRPDVLTGFFVAPLDTRLSSSRGMALAGEDDADEAESARLTRGAVADLQTVSVGSLGSRPRYLLESQPVRYELRSTSF